MRCRACNPQHQLRFLGEQAEVEIVKKVIPSGLFVPLRFVEGYDGRSGTVWVLQDGRLAKRRVQTRRAVARRPRSGHVGIAGTGRDRRPVRSARRPRGARPQRVVT